MHANSQSQQKEIPASFFALRFCTHSSCHDCSDPSSLKDVQSPFHKPSYLTLYRLPAAVPLKRKAEVSPEFQIPWFPEHTSPDFSTAWWRSSSLSTLLCNQTAFVLLILFLQNNKWICSVAPAAHSSPSSLPKWSRNPCSHSWQPSGATSTVSCPRTHLEQPDKEGQIPKDHWEFEIPKGWVPPTPRHFCPQLWSSKFQIQASCPNPGRWRGTLTQEQPAQVSWTQRASRARLKRRFSTAREVLLQHFIWWVGRCKKISFSSAESGRRTSMFQCVTAFFTALWTKALLQLKNICKLNFLGNFPPCIFSISRSICF